MFIAIFTDVTLGQSLLISLVCILIVFAMLALLWGIVALFKYIPQKKEKNEEVKPVVKNQNNKSFTMNDIKDDDMMAAALIATIDYHNEIKKDVRVVSIKEL